jgi:uncharacterized coiled-coil protein SlyX
MKTLVSAIAILAASGGYANAACNVTAPTIASHLAGAHTETDCASAADVAAHGVSIGSLQTDVGALQAVTIDHEGRIVALETNDGLQDAALTTHTAAIASHTATLADHETRITSGEAKDVEQDVRHDTAEAKNGEQDGRLDGHDATLAAHGSTLTTHTAQIGSLETVTAGHETRLNAHDAMLSQHAATLDAYGDKLEDHSKGLAIAMALPDAWLSDKKSFGIFGSVGGFDNETAIGFAAIGRIDETWSLNGKLGADTEFERFGWQVGAGAQW